MIQLGQKKLAALPSYDVNAVINHVSGKHWLVDTGTGNILDCSWAIEPAWLGTLEEDNDHKVQLRAGSAPGEGVMPQKGFSPFYIEWVHRKVK